MTTLHFESVWVEFTGRIHPRFGPELRHGPSGTRVGYRYRKAAVRLEYKYACELLPRTITQLKKGLKPKVSWEAAGLAADLREAGFEWTSISIIVGNTPAELAHNVARFFPEIADSYETEPLPEPSPERLKIQTLIEQGWSNRAIARHVGVTIGIVAGIRHRLGKRKQQEPINGRKALSQAS